MLVSEVSVKRLRVTVKNNSPYLVGLGGEMPPKEKGQILQRFLTRQLLNRFHYYYST